MKTPNQLWKEFNNLSLGKQSLISVGTILLIITLLSNYKNIKDCGKSFVEKFSQDENIKEFMSDVNKVVESFFSLTRKFFKGEETKEETQKIQLND